MSGALRLRLRRFLLDDEVDEDVEDVEVGLVTELGLDDRTVVKRHHRYVNEEHKSTRHESRVYATAAAAARALEKSIKTLEGKGYLEDEPVEVEVDLQEAAAARADAKAVSDPLRVVSDEVRRGVRAGLVGPRLQASADLRRGVSRSATWDPPRGDRGRVPGARGGLLRRDLRPQDPLCRRRTRGDPPRGGASSTSSMRTARRSALAQHRLERGGGDTDDADVGGGLARMRRLLLPTA
ncbi:MAG: hypothetical protein IPF92_08365 [Myxococcales bacterium]|nr:hypothetical protein [Myxococcales bacterium]